MELTLLTVPDCPNAAAFEERLAVALASHPAAIVRHRVITGDREAEEAGMHGSPTLLIDGTDPFAHPGEPPSMSCRLYRDAEGRTEAVPTVAELRQVLARSARADPGGRPPGAPRDAV
jgi:hypothetical protein